MSAAPPMTADQRTEELGKMVDASRAKLQQQLRKEQLRNQWPYARKSLYNVVKSHRFELACGAIILINMFLVVIETDAGVNGGEAPAWLGWATLMLLGIYTTELVVKLYVFRVEFFFEAWNLCDFVVVGTDLVFLFVGLIVPMPSISILRVFRLVKLARAFKAAKSFPELRSLLRACACALRAIFWGMLLLIMALTVWGILAVQLIHPINRSISENKPWLYEGCERCPRAYETVFGSMLTFWKQLVAGDSWGTLCEPIIEEANWTAFFFMLVLVTVNLTMLNCILAVVVEAGASAAAADEHDKAMEREKMVVGAEGKLIDLCHGLDGDQSGSLSIEEFYEGFKSNREFKECLELMHVSEADMKMIFNICDEDDSGDVDYREFVEQLRRIKHSSEQIILNYVTDIRHMVNKIRPEVLKPNRRTVDSEALLQSQEQKKQVFCRDGSQLHLDAVQKSGNSATEEAGPSQYADTLYPGLVKAADPSDSMEALGLMPPELGGLLLESSDQPKGSPATLERKAQDTAGGKSAKIEDKATDQDQAGGAQSSIDQIVPQGWWERIWQVNQDLVTIMREHSDQNQVTHQLLNTLVKCPPNSVVSVGSGRLQARVVAEADVVPWDPRASGRSVTMAASARDRGATESGCCVRVV